MERLKNYWNEFLEILEKKEEYNAITLLESSAFIIDENNNPTIVCSGDFAATHIKKDFLKRIEDFFKEKCENDIDIKIVVDADFIKENNIKKEIKEDIRENTINNVNSEKKIDKYNLTNLKKEFRFDNFIYGNNNRHIFELAKLVSSKPGTEYNPLYIYGSVGIGKTHILQAIGNNYLEINKNAKILYIEGSGFRDEYIHGLQIKKPDIFKRKYKSLDMFLLDDLQLLESAQETSKELFEIFQVLYNAGKQMVFVSDKPPKELRNIEARLKNRFEQSLIWQIEPPQYETRLAIIERKVKDLNTSIDKEIMKYMAENITTDVRKIEGAIKSYLSVRDIMKITPNVSQCDEMNIFKDYFTSKPKLQNATVREIKKRVSDYYGIEISLLDSKDRTKFISKARHVAMYLACEYSKKSVTEIGLDFNRDHASVIHGRDKIREELKSNSHLSLEIDQIISSFNHS
ncbi:chromosomal replication initiator protein DnaA [Brachyspira catarrhinii]|uniref:Chromosomal replication initiator protein DnaA n=1 Tax=Brachyspira catarrhinii TaxID=2528966 RepID=A0ABY2TPS8_9SPIR|nr:chromosomal replication initiator protein DnaA [Brachyspira catarrhinii]TKZ33916.1 chromosomal replication initiator protein DnaA [Brachyspira catarrhinii]